MSGQARACNRIPEGWFLMSATLQRLRFVRVRTCWLGAATALVAALALLLTASVMPASAQSANGAISQTAAEEKPNATIQAVSYAPLLKGATMVPEAAISSATNESIRDRISEALRRRGFKLADDGLYVVQFDYIDPGYEARKKAFQDSDKGSPEIRIGIVDGKVKTAESGVKLPVKDGKLGKPDSRVPAARPTLHRLQITIAKPGGAKMWEGSIEGHFAGGHREVAEAMVEALTQKIGETVEKSGYQLEAGQ